MEARFKLKCSIDGRPSRAPGVCCMLHEEALRDPVLDMSVEMKERLEWTGETERARSYIEFRRGRVIIKEKTI